MKNRDEEMTRKIDMENLQAMLRLLSWLLYSLDVGNYSKVNASNFIDDIDELWIGDNARWYKIVEFWGDTIIWHGKLCSQVTLKSYTWLLLFNVYVKMISITNRKIGCY